MQRPAPENKVLQPGEDKRRPKPEPDDDDDDQQESSQ